MTDSRRRALERRVAEGDTAALMQLFAERLRDFDLPAVPARKLQPPRRGVQLRDLVLERTTEGRALLGHCAGCVRCARDSLPWHFCGWLPGSTECDVGWRLRHEALDAEGVLRDAQERAARERLMKVGQRRKWR